MTEIRTVFDIAARAMAAQMQRMNTSASNLANAGTVTGSADTAFRPLRPVFSVTEAAPGSGLAAPLAEQVVQLDRSPDPVYRPDHPAADAEGYVYTAPVQAEEELVEIIEASRQYQNTLEAVSTLRTLMARTLSMGS
jgi:flagellar basal-body rod protein FlgC